MNIPLNSFQIKLYSYLIYIKSLWRLICSSWAQVDSNHRPRAYQARALTSWAMSPHAVLVPLQLALELSHGSIISLNRCLQLRWRWWDSNPWPPACRAGALPTELHPHWFIGSLFSFNELSLTENWTTTSVPSPIAEPRVCPTQFSLERRWSSRTFRYGYLVTT